MWRVLYPHPFARRPVNIYGLMQMEWPMSIILLHPCPFAWSSIPLQCKQSGGCGGCSTPVCFPGGGYARHLSRPCPTPVTCLVERLVSLEVFLLYQSSLDLTCHSQSRTCIAHLTSAKSILDPWHISLLVLMTWFLYLLCQSCFCPCLCSPPLVYFIDLVPFLLPPCSISKCLLVTVYTPSCFISYKYPSTSPCIGQSEIN